jgi:hypothetical protein
MGLEEKDGIIKRVLAGLGSRKRRRRASLLIVSTSRYLSLRGVSFATKSRFCTVHIYTPLPGYQMDAGGIRKGTPVELVGVHYSNYLLVHGRSRNSQATPKSQRLQRGARSTWSMKFHGFGLLATALVLVKKVPPFFEAPGLPPTYLGKSIIK